VDELSNMTKKFILSMGADLVGIAPISRFDGAPKGHKPQDILSDAKSVIVFANRNPNSIVMDGPATSYHHMMITFYNKLDLIANETAIYIEQQGGAAIPIPSDDPYFDWNPDKVHGRGDLSHKHAAQAAGIGRLGKNSLLITPEFGNRVQLVSVVTNADLETDPLIKSELCPSKCTLCVEACPVKAITDEQIVNQKLCRSYMFLELPKGQKIYGCRECRKTCTVGVKSRATT
jgi:epoxyqueuosine reductase